MRQTRKTAPKSTPQIVHHDERMKLEEAFLFQKQLLATRDYAEAVMEAVPPLLVLDENTRVQTANKPSAESSNNDAAIRVWFEDNASGIAPENHSRIFRLFERIHPTTQYEGTGIGLSIVRKAIERMNGQLNLESNLGEGSSFWIQLKKA